MSKEDGVNSPGYETRIRNKLTNKYLQSNKLRKIAIITADYTRIMHRVPKARKEVVRLHSGQSPMNDAMFYNFSAFSRPLK